MSSIYTMIYSPRRSLRIQFMTLIIVAGALQSPCCMTSESNFPIWVWIVLCFILSLCNLTLWNPFDRSYLDLSFLLATHWIICSIDCRGVLSLGNMRFLGTLSMMNLGLVLSFLGIV